MMQTTIRPENPTDVDTIESVIAAAFQGVAHSNQTEPHIVRRLRNAGALAVSLVAELDGDIVGHVAISPVWISDGSAGWFGLGPIAVVPQHQGCGVGTRLMERSVEDLRKSGAAGCVLLGKPEFYGRFGFRHEPALQLPDVPPEHFLALPFSETVPEGIVSYHEAFNAGD